MTEGLGAGVATGIGSWPGDDVRAALAVVRDELTDVPHLPELPARGPGADLIGRGAALLVDLPVELQTHGWRLADHPGRDALRGASYLRGDLDELAEAFDGYRGPLKIQVTGPWTLAASLWLPRGERVLSDPGARRDVVESLALGAVRHLESVRSAAPGAAVVVQIDEPSLPSVLAGRLPRASGYGLVRSVDGAEVRDGLATIVDAAHAAGAATAIHCCAPAVPVELLRRSGAMAMSLDLSLMTTAGWEELAEAIEAGLALWAGVVPTTDPAEQSVAALVESVQRPWQQVGLPLAGLADVVVTPTCGLAGLSPDQARHALRRAVAAARALAEEAHEG